MATIPAGKSDEYRAHLYTFNQSIQDSFGAKYANSKDSDWKIWGSHCPEFRLAPSSRPIMIQAPHLAIFAQRYQSGVTAPKKKPVSADYVSDILCSIGQAFSSVGTPNPRFSAIDEKINFQLR